MNAETLHPANKIGWLYRRPVPGSWWENVGTETYQGFNLLSLLVLYQHNEFFFVLFLVSTVFAYWRYIFWFQHTIYPKYYFLLCSSLPTEWTDTLFKMGCNYNMKCNLGHNSPTIELNYVMQYNRFLTHILNISLAHYFLVS